MNEDHDRSIADTVDEWAELHHIVKIGRALTPDEIRALADHYGSTWAVAVDGSGRRHLTVDPGTVGTDEHAPARAERRDWTVTVPTELLGHLIDIAKHAKAYEDAQPDRQWRIGDPHAQRLHEANMDLDEYTARHSDWLEEAERAMFDAEDG